MQLSLTGLGSHLLSRRRCSGAGLREAPRAGELASAEQILMLLYPFIMQHTVYLLLPPVSVIYTPVAVACFLRALKYDNNANQSEQPACVAAAPLDTSLHYVALL